MSRPINKMVLLDHEKDKAQIIAHKSISQLILGPIFEVLNEKGISSEEESDEINSCVGVKHPAWTLF